MMTTTGVVFQSLARIAVEKIDEVTAGNFIDAMITDEESADMEAMLAAQRTMPDGSAASKLAGPDSEGP
jgi:hypothetical protein